MKKERWVIGLVLIMLTVWCGVSWSDPAKGTGADSALSSEPVYWYEGDVRRTAWLALDEMAVFPNGRGADLSTALARADEDLRLVSDTGYVQLYKTVAAVDADGVRARAENLNAVMVQGQAGPVFYGTAQKQDAARIIPTGEIIVKFPASLVESDIADKEAEYGLIRVKAFDFSPNTFLYRAEDAFEAISLANRIHEAGDAVFSYPNWLRHRVLRSTRATPNDPLYPDQWHLNNTGQGGGTAGEDVNITSVWDVYRGSINEVIAITDEGVELTHEDIAPNVLAGYSWDWVDNDADPDGGKHGQSCAGVAAARGFNNIGVTGAAPNAALIGYRLLGADTDANTADALTRHMDVVDINNNSWGPDDDGQQLAGPGPLTATALEAAVTNGRGGLGEIIVWAGGNGNTVRDNSNYDGYANSRYTIAVAASTDLGNQSYYSEEGANIVVNAPSSGGISRITTTDRTPPNGYNTTGSYTGTFGGTSSATPLVAGIVALMLQANPDLTWRDVIGILVETAFQNDPADTDWILNGAGYHINHCYGFGRIDALAAVAASHSWTSYGAEITAQAEAGPNLSIPDNDATGVSSTIDLNSDITIEYVDITFSAADHPSWGDLEVTLTSPAGTPSVLAESHSGGTNATYNNWTFGSIRPFGESSQGTWTLTVKDRVTGHTGTFQNWKIKVYGNNGSGGRFVTGSGSSSGGCFIHTLDGREL